MTVKKLFTVVVAVLLALSTFVLSPPAAACCSPVSYTRNEATDQLTLSNYNFSTRTIRFEYSDSTYGLQTATLDPGETAVMCAAEGAVPQIKLTFDVGTPEETVIYKYFSSVYSPGWDVDALQQQVVDAKRAVTKAKKRFKRTKRAVVKVRIVVARAKASHRQVWVKNASRWLKKTKAKVKKTKAKVKKTKAKLASAKSDLAEVQEVISYCAERRLQ
jgi:ribosomal protein L11